MMLHVSKGFEACCLFIAGGGSDSEGKIAIRERCNITLVSSLKSAFAVGEKVHFLVSSDAIARLHKTIIAALNEAMWAFSRPSAGDKNIQRIINPNETTPPMARGIGFISCHHTKLQLPSGPVEIHNPNPLRRQDRKYP